MYLVCWNRNCRQTYPASNFKVTDMDVKCEKCGGTLISPSGKVQISQNPWVLPTVDPEKLGQSRSGQVEKVGKEELGQKFSRFVVEPQDIIMFDYINWKSNKSTRIVEVGELYYGSTKYHPEKQWLLEAYDIVKEDVRVFALKDITNVKRLTETSGERRTL